MPSIVAVHDVHGDSLESWTHPQTGANWLRDFLPEHIRVARVLTYCYNSTSAALFSNDAPDAVRGTAESLVQELRANRQFSRALRRPIVFVCHGFGVVLVKKSLLYSSTRTVTKVVHLWDMYISTFAIIFLGTPHSQTNKANWLELDAMARGLRPSSTLLSSRSKYAEMEDAPLPSSIDSEFSPLIKQFHMFFFWEELPTAFGSRLANHDAAELLKIMAFFHFELIPLEAFTRAVANRVKALCAATSGSGQSRLANRIRARLEPPVLLPGFLKGDRGHLDKYRINWAIAELQSLSFIRSDGEYVSLHPLIHSWACDRLTLRRRHI